MKLIVMVPCYNEEKTLPLVINSMPKEIDGIDEIETLVIDDGSADDTYQVAKDLGVTYVLKNKGNKGLAFSFQKGLDFALKKGADVIVNTDGDNQYPQQDIPRLVQPILDGEAEIVIADRQTDKIAHFSPLKKILQNFGSWVVRLASGADIPDAVSGFRAYSKYAAEQLNVVTEFSYVIETIIQASKKRIPLTSIKVKTNPKTRESRLFKSLWGHVKSSAATIIRVFAMYEPLKAFTYASFIFFFPGLILGVRFLYFFFLNGSASGHIQSLILASILIIVGFQIFLFGILADLVANNRKLIEKIISGK
jgi:glycosyltransferase involved in cell wall biosynthesis